MAYFRILCATTAGIGCFYGPRIDQRLEQTFKVKALTLDPKRTPGSEHYQNPHLESRFARYGLPQRDVTLRYKHFQMSYDQRNRMPNWVLEHLNCNKLNAPGNRAFSRRSATRNLDPRIKVEFQSDGIDYETEMVGYPLADHVNYPTKQGISDAHTRTNSVPQNVQFITGVWRDLNIYCRYLTKIYEDVYVFTGPLIQPIAQDHMQYRVSQTNRIAFPSHYFKIVICKRENKFDVGCFVFPNRRIGPEYSLSQFQVPLTGIEQAVGFKLFRDGVYLTEVALPNCFDFRQRRLFYMPNERQGEIGIPQGPDNIEGGGDLNGHNVQDDHNGYIAQADHNGHNENLHQD